MIRFESLSKNEWIVTENKLLGVEADKFFGPVGTRYSLAVRLVGEHPILIAKEIQRPQ